MTDAPLNEQELSLLREIDTPTICNALEIVSPDRRAIGFTVSHLHCAFPALPPMVGYARTARVRAATPPLAGNADQTAARLAYYRSVAAGHGPTVMVIEDIDTPPGFGSWWGEVHSNVHRALGALGVVTSGSVRDLDMIAEGFQLISVGFQLIAPRFQQGLSRFELSLPLRKLSRLLLDSARLFEEAIRLGLQFASQGYQRVRPPF